MAEDRRLGLSMRIAVIAASFIAAGSLGYAAIVQATLGQMANDPRVLPVFFEMFLRYDVPAAGLSWVIVVVACVAARFLRVDLQPLLLAVDAHPLRLATAAGACYALASYPIFGGQPIVVDEYAPLLQSKVFAQSELLGRLPPELIDRLVPKHWQGQFIKVSHESGAIASAYWPTLALALTPFTAIGLPWLFNPLVGALTIALLARLLDQLIGMPAARGFALLATALSPAVVLNSMSLYAMPLLLLTSVAFTLLVLRGTSRALILAGVTGSLALTAVNPVPHTLFAAPWLAFILWKTTHRARALGSLALGYLPLCLLLGVGWPVLTGHVTDPVPDASTSSLGAMLSIFALPDTDLLATRMIALFKIDLWAVPGLAAMALIGSWWARTGPMRCMLGAAVLTLGGYLFVPFDQGPGWGYRYFHATWLALPVLAALAWTAVASRLESSARLATFGAVSCIATFICLVPLRMAQAYSFVAEQQSLVPPRAAGPDRQLVFVDLQCGPRTSVLVQNDPFLENVELRLVDQGTRLNLAAAKRFSSKATLTAVGRCGERWKLD